jgi:superfamily II DNA helicase RecQ
MSEPERLLYEKLQSWRKEQAQKDGVPVFIIATNRELAEAATKAPETLEALRQIKGFGKRKIERYGKPILHIIQHFYERKGK